MEPTNNPMPNPAPATPGAPDTPVAPVPPVAPTTPEAPTAPEAPVAPEPTPVMIVDHPFLFIIRNNDLQPGNDIIFISKVECLK